MKLSKEALFFRAADGSCVLYTNSWGDSIFFSADGKKFFEVEGSGQSGSEDDHEFSFEDPHHNLKGKIRRKDDALKVNGKTYKKVRRPSKVAIVRLPRIRESKHLFLIPDGGYVYVSSDRFHDEYEEYKLFIGRGAKLRNVKIKKDGIDMLRDGGTMWIDTVEGRLHISAPSRREPATWKETIELQKLDLSLYEIVESKDGVEVKKREL